MAPREPAARDGVLRATRLRSHRISALSAAGFIGGGILLGDHGLAHQQLVRGGPAAAERLGGLRAQPLSQLHEPNLTAAWKMGVFWLLLKPCALGRDSGADANGGREARLHSVAG